MRTSIEYTILDAIGTLTATFTAATTDVITSASHGLKNGDMVVLTTTDTLPASLATATGYFVINASTNTFKLSLTSDGSSVNITDTGTGTHTWTMHDIGRNILVQDFINSVLSLSTDGTANFVIKFQGSIQDTCPDFSAAQTVANHWDYIEVVDIQSGAAIDGDTGITFSAADDNRLLEMNIDGLKWINAIISSYVAGTATLKVRLFDNQ